MLVRSFSQSLCLGEKESLSAVNHCVVFSLFVLICSIVCVLLFQVRFEVLTSEASYCRSLDIVVEHFVMAKQLGALVTMQDRNWLFSRLADVRAISHRLEILNIYPSKFLIDFWHIFYVSITSV